MVTCRAAGLSALPEVRVGVPAAHRQVVERLSRHSMETTTALSQLAGRGDLDAQFRLGYRLMFCRDRQHRDLIKAFRLWKQAAEQGHVRARFYLATATTSGRGPARTFGSPCGGTSKPPSPDTRWRNTIWRWGCAMELV